MAGDFVHLHVGSDPRTRPTLCKHSDSLSESCSANYRRCPELEERHLFNLAFLVGLRTAALAPVFRVVDSAAKANVTLSP